MQANTNAAEKSLAFSGADITPEQITNAYLDAIEGLLAVGKATIRFAERCVFAGNLLRAKKAFLGYGDWEKWMAEKCPEVSPSTIKRLIRISKIVEEKLGNRPDAVDLAKLPLPERLKSVEGLYDALRETAEEEPSDKPTPTPSRLKAAISGFWKAITKNPPEKWDGEERKEFLVDLAGRERIRRERGWELPVFDIESETKL